MIVPHAFAKKIVALSGLSLIIIPTLFGMNVVRPFDSYLRPEPQHNKKTQFYTIMEHGVKERYYNEDNQISSALQLWQADQNALAMLNGFPQEGPIGEFRDRVINANDDGIRGHYCVDGDLKVRFASTFSCIRFVHEKIALSLHLPVYSMELSNVAWRSLTKNNTAQDARVQENLTQTNELFFSTVQRLGCGLDLQCWQRSGIGDLLLRLDFIENYPQYKPILKNVRLNGRFGIFLPTGEKSDEDKLLAFPFGYDGSVALTFGGGINLTLGQYIRGGIDVDLTHSFSSTKKRRIKTDERQTELLLLLKTDTRKDFGFIQRFNLFYEFYHIVQGFSASLAYEFLRKGEDELALETNTSLTAIANTAEKLQEWTTHNLIFKANYAFGYAHPERRIIPEIACFVRLPFNGKRSSQALTIGGMLSVAF